MIEELVEGLIEKGAAVAQDTIRKYKPLLPAELIEIWEKYGYATLLDGNLRLIDPDEYREIVDETYFRANIAIPIMVTAFGDVLTYEEGRYVSSILYINADCDVVTAGFDWFLRDMREAFFVNKYLRFREYQEAVKRLGRLEHDECYGYVPLLGIGGKKKVQNLQKFKTKEHIMLNVYFLGGV